MKGGRGKIEGFNLCLEVKGVTTEVVQAKLEQDRLYKLSINYYRLIWVRLRKAIKFKIIF